MEKQLIFYADLFGTAVFALTGAIKGIAHKLDLLGVIVLGCTVGIGGGLLRDSVLGMTPAAALSHSVYLLLCIVTSLAVFLMPRRYLRRNREIVVYADAVGLGVFTAIGNAKACQLGLPPITVILTGVITAAGGGVLRDVLVSSIPQVLKSDFYATASLLGGLLYCVLYQQNVSAPVLFLCVSLFVMLLRIVAFHRKIQLPKTAKLNRPGRSRSSNR